MSAFVPAAATSRGPAPAEPVYVLSIDGGGIRGLIPALVLEHLETLLAQEAELARIAPPSIAQSFDVVAGASTGGIIAIGLTAPHPETPARPLLDARALVDLYSERGAEIFSRRRGGWLSQVTTAAYCPRPLERILEEMLGDATLSDVRTGLVLPSYNMGRRTVTVFRRRLESGPESVWPADYYLRDVARAISAAPSYFASAEIAPVAGMRTEHLIDGAVYANNPALLAYVEAVRRYPGAPVVVLSIGTGQVNRRLPLKRMRRGGLTAWFNLAMRLPLLDVMLDGQVDTVDEALAAVLEPGSGYFRYDPDLPPALEALDNPAPENLAGLHAVGRDILDSREAELRGLARRLVARHAAAKGVAPPRTVPEPPV